MFDVPNKGTISPQELTEQLATEAHQMKRTRFICQPHKQLMNNLLEQVQKVDFRALAGFDADDENSPLKKQHKLIIVVDNVIKLAKANRWDLCRRDAFFYTYNGAYWKPLGKDDLKDFLKKAAERMGIDRFDAQYVEFAKSLFDQFNEQAYLPAPTTDHEAVKINLQNGTFSISTESQELSPPDATDFLTHQLPFAYDPEATAPMFQAFLDRVQPDTDCQNVLAEYLGYVFINPAKLKLEKTLLLYGSGANGKSVFFEIVMALLGPDNVSNYSLQNLTTGNAYCRAHLATKLVNYASEINGNLEADTFKQMVSGEPVEARLPYGQPFIMTNYAKLIFNCNELPTDVEHTHAYFRRFLIVPFTVTIPEQEQDRRLATKIIQAELSGVFNWILAGLRRLLEQGRFTDAEAVRMQITAYQQQSDTVRQFMEEQGYQASSDFTALKDLYRDYKAYCIEDNYRPVNNRNFQKRLKAVGFQTDRARMGYVVYATRPDMAF